MNKKVLYGSIFTIAVIILVSFSSAVEMQSIESSTKNDSPLFNIRTNKANEKESTNLTCDFVGKGKSIDIPILNRDIFVINLIKSLKYLMKMDKNEIKKSLTEFMSNQEIWLNAIKKIDEGLFKNFSEFLNNNKTWIKSLNNFDDLNKNIQSQLEKNPKIRDYLSNNYSRGIILETSQTPTDGTCYQCGPTIIQIWKLCLMDYFVVATFFIASFSIIAMILFVDLIIIITLVPLFLLMTIFTPENCPYNPGL